MWTTKERIKAILRLPYLWCFVFFRLVKHTGIRMAFLEATRSVWAVGSLAVGK